MHRDPGVQRRPLDVKRNEKADRDPAARTAARAIFTADFGSAGGFPGRCSTSIHIQCSSTYSAKRPHTAPGY